MKFRICFPIIPTYDNLMVLAVCFVYAVYQVVPVLFLFIKEYHLYFLNLHFCIMELKLRSPSISHLYS
jgi:hypothetical protein